MTQRPFFLRGRRRIWAVLPYVCGVLGCGMLGMGMKKYVFSPSLPASPQTFRVWKGPQHPWRVQVHPTPPDRWQVYHPLQEESPSNPKIKAPLPFPRDPRSPKDKTV